MQQIKTKEQLEEKISHCTECLNQKLNSKGKRSVLICGGTGCKPGRLLRFLFSGSICENNARGYAISYRKGF